MNTQFRSGVAALNLLALVACLASANQGRLKVEATAGSSAIAPERRRISLALEIGQGRDSATIVRFSARAAPSPAGRRHVE